MYHLLQSVVEVNSMEFSCSQTNLLKSLNDLQLKLNQSTLDDFFSDFDDEEE